MEKNPHFVKLQQIPAYATTEDTSVYREEYTFRKCTTNNSLCQKRGYLSREMNPHFVKLQHMLPEAINENTQYNDRNPHFVK